MISYRKTSIVCGNDRYIPYPHVSATSDKTHRNASSKYPHYSILIEQCCAVINDSKAVKCSKQQTESIAQTSQTMFEAIFQDSSSELDSAVEMETL